jgi:transcriptional regulator with XRE-family HTH domain
MLVRHRVREVRLARGFSQGALAEALGLCDRTAISQLERRIVEPKLSTLERIAAVLGCSRDDLLPVDTSISGDAAS